MEEWQKDKKVLVLVERENGGLASVTLELLQAGKDLADKIGGNLCAMVLGYEICDMSNEIVHFSDEVYCIDNPLLRDFRSELYAHVLWKICRDINFDIVLMGHTLNNLDLAPRLAYKMGVQIITDCINLAIETETEYLLCTKPVYGAKIVATFKLEKRPYMVTVRSKVIEPIGSGHANGKVIHLDPTIDESSINVALIEKIKEETISLDKADTIVAGGRGIKDVEGLKQLEEMVRVLRRYFSKVELGASRPLVDMGLVPSYRQVGLTGEKVAPELYIAVGISGSMQHLTGMLGAKNIVAINNNPKAPIFEVAHYGVVGDYQDVVPAIIKKLEELL
jgi:electron transfer flavoprotein alpha subunit